MDMGMVGERLAPSVQDSDAADPGAKSAWIGGERRHRLCRGPEQDRVGDGLVLEGDRGDWRGQREDDVEIGDRQKFALTFGEPLGSRRPLTLRTAPVAAGVIGDPRRAAVVAGLDMSAERRRPARNYGAHDTPLDTTQMTGMLTAIGIAMAAQDVGDLQANAMRSSIEDGSVRKESGAGHGPGVQTRSQPGGVTSSDRRSSGLCVARIVWVATCV